MNLSSCCIIASPKQHIHLVWLTGESDGAGDLALLLLEPDPIHLSLPLACPPCRSTTHPSRGGASDPLGGLPEKVTRSHLLPWQLTVSLHLQNRRECRPEGPCSLICPLLSGVFWSEG